MGKKKEYTWVGGAQIIEPETDASTTPGELLVLVPGIQTTEVVGGPQNCLVEAIYLNFSIRRILLSAIDALTYMVYVGDLADNSNVVSTALNSQSLNDRLYSRKDIMMLGQLPVPPLLVSPTPAFTTSEEVLVHHAEYQASRKLNRAGQSVVMAVNCDVSVATRVFCQWRVLLSY